MSLPAYLFLYDTNGVQIKGDCSLLMREGAIEIMSSQHNISQSADAYTGRLTGTRMHDAYTLHKQIDKTSPLLNNAACTGQVFLKAEIRYYAINSAGIEYETYRITMERVVVTYVAFSHAYIPGAITPNMLEIIGLRYNKIEWHYVTGNIKYEDSWLSSSEANK
ncbi:type VI secretion system tube protein TssD [Pluralibacter sp.]|uniref:Hcp family type VI secretion system effector n=1 Tax=Pluralibacter sp. TaxID=1920032 RepID=UPI0025EBDE1D|nr:type VI secretion system tube protein TssD [Pluralibacter sp.]MBV8042045.1 type VI secretion system tube protein Hcp [Pluralibacter sp.]